MESKFIVSVRFLKIDVGYSRKNATMPLIVGRSGLSKGVGVKVVESQLGGVFDEKIFLGGNPLAECLNASPERYTRDTILGVTYSWTTNYGNCDRIFFDFKS